MTEFNQKKSIRGGQRSGAGRPAGAANKKTREIANRAAEQGVTPLEVMIEAMRDAYGGRGCAKRCGKRIQGLNRQSAFATFDA